MRLLIIFLALLLIMAWVRTIPSVATPVASLTLVVGLLLLAGYSAGQLLSRLKLPRITGYLAVGILVGPYALGLLSLESITDLGFLNELAVTFIALAAGGELRISELRPRRKAIGWAMLGTTVVTGALVVPFVLFARSLLPFVAGFTHLQVLSVAALFAVLAVARSPSSAIAVIQETGSKGPFTETALGVTVGVDVVVIILFAAAISLAEALLTPGSSVDPAYLGALMLEIGSGVGIGLVIGKGLAVYTDRVRANLPILLLGTALLTGSLSHALADYLHQAHDLSLRLEPLLICVTAGFTIQNFSARGGDFIRAVNAIGLPVYVVFFSLAGAGLDLDALSKAWVVALLLVVVRGLGIWVGAYVAGRVAGDSPGISRLSGLTYLTQAGVSIGLALEVARRFPGWGETFVTIIVAAIAINQVIGPIAMKQALVLSGEARET